VSDIGPSIGFLEVSSLAKGYEALDAMLKRAAVEPLMVTAVPRGKLLIMIGGPLAEIEASMSAGLELAGKTVVDSFTIQNVHQQLPGPGLDVLPVRHGQDIGPTALVHHHHTHASIITHAGHGCGRSGGVGAALRPPARGPPAAPGGPGRDWRAPRRAGGPRRAGRLPGG